MDGFATAEIPSSDQARVVAIDTETTGLSATARIVEVAAVEVRPRTGQLGRRLHWVIDPRVSIPAVATRIHGIADSDVAGKPSFEAVAAELSDFLCGATLVAQNAAFDSRVLDAELARIGRRPLAGLGVRIVDTVAISRALFPLEHSHHLDAICDRSGVERTARRRHGALIDTELLARTLPHLATAYDAWCSSDDAPVDVHLQDFERQADAACEQFAAQATAPELERADRTFQRIATALAGLRCRERVWMERAENEVAAAGWCAKDFAASWSTSRSITWKDAALACLSETDLAAFRSLRQTQVLTSLRTGDDATSAPLFEPLEELGESLAGAPAGRVLRAVLAIRRAAKRLSPLKDGLRASLLVAAAGGYQLRHAVLHEGIRTYTDYRGAMSVLAPDADLSLFTTENQALRLRARDMTSCGVLFGPLSGETAASPIERVA